jgi:hypothetical protein
LIFLCLILAAELSHFSTKENISITIKQPSLRVKTEEMSILQRIKFGWIDSRKKHKQE